MCQISAKSEHAFVFYGEFCEVCEMKMMKKKKKTKKLKRKFVRSYLGNGWSDFLQIWYVDYPNWAERLQQIWFQSDKGSQSYIGVKIAFSFFLLIYSRCGAPASWAARHTIVCLDLIQNSQAVKKSAALKKAMVKKDVKSKVAGKKWL